MSTPPPEPKPTGQDKITRDEAIEALLTDEELGDMTLRGSDGSLVHANRFMLAARSTVFRRMLLGKFLEASNSVIDLGYEEMVLRAIRDFIYKDHSKFFDKPCFPDLVPAVVALVDAGNYLALPELSHRAEQFAETALQRNDSLSGAFFAACEPYGEAAAGVEKLALKVIQANPQVLLDKSSLRLLSATQLEKVLHNDTLQVEEITLFMLIQLWSNSLDETSSDVVEESSVGNDSELGRSGSRQKQAVDLIKHHIHLDYIDPSTLSSTVALSGLVSVEQLSEAYKAQAMLAQCRRGLEWLKSRKELVWKGVPGSGFTWYGDEARKLRMLRLDQVMKSGIHKWRIFVEELGSEGRLGISRMAGDYNDLAPESWFYRNDGHKTRWSGDKSRRIDTPFTQGSIVTFKLDLTGSKGVLSFSVDGKQIGLHFSDIVIPGSFPGLQPDVGFVPSAAFNDTGKVRFLGFEEVASFSFQGVN